MGSDFAVKLILLKRIRNILNNYLKKYIKWSIWLFTPIFISRLFVFYLFFIFLILNFLSLQVLKIKVIIFFFFCKNYNLKRVRIKWSVSLEKTRQKEGGKFGYVHLYSIIFGPWERAACESEQGTKQMEFWIAFSNGLKVKIKFELGFEIFSNVTCYRSC